MQVKCNLTFGTSPPARNSIFFYYDEEIDVENSLILLMINLYVPKKKLYMFACTM